MTPSDAETLAAGGLTWLLGLASDTGNGLIRTGSPDDDEVDPTLYCGTAGVLALACDRHARGRDDLGFAEVLVDESAGPDHPVVQPPRRRVGRAPPGNADRRRGLAPG